MWVGSTRCCRWLLALALFFPSILIAADASPIAKEWKFDQLRLRNGSLLKGLILEETGDGVRFQHVFRATGRPTVTMTAYIRLADIEKIDKVTDEQRELLQTRLRELDPRGEGERKRMESLDLKSCDWEGTTQAGRRYNSEYFILISNAPEEVVRRAAVRLEQIYAAYNNLMPARGQGKPTTIMLYPSLEDYQKMLARQGWKLQNTAFFHPGDNRIVCASNLLKMGEDLEKTRKQHVEQRAELAMREAFLRQYYGKKPMELARHLQPILDFRKDIAKADRHNDAIFDNETKRLFTILYHEAFHAYTGNFVFPQAANTTARPTGELPRWLNEGLAQIFETALVESGELRVGHADSARLGRVKEVLKKGELMPLAELLHAGTKPFLVQHGDDKLTSDRVYLASWALAAYLTFDRRLLGTAALDEFVRSVHENQKPEAAFARLVGQKLPDFEKDFHSWLTRLQTNGSMFEPVANKNP